MYILLQFSQTVNNYIVITSSLYVPNIPTPKFPDETLSSQYMLNLVSSCQKQTKLK